MPFEKSVTSSIIAYFKSIGGQAEKIKGDSSSSGRPDINACYRGRCYRIEVKTPDNQNTPSRKQKLNLKRWKHSGAVCMSVYSKKSVMYFVTCVGMGQHGAKFFDEDNSCVSECFIPRVVK